MKFNQNNIKRAIVSAFVVGSVGISAPSYANDTMLVSTTVGAACVLSIDSTMAFTNYDPIGTHINAGADDLTKAQKISAQCTAGMSAKIKLTAGLHTNGAAAGADVIAPARRMKHTVGEASHYLAYNLYKADGAAAAIWGGGATGGQVHLGTGTATDLTIFGRVTAGQTAIYNATYSDTVVVSYILG